jgi:alpha-N-arabinofuranosidase
MNRHHDDAISTDISFGDATFRGPIEVYEVNGSNVKLQNDFGTEPITTVQKPNLQASGSAVTYSFPAHSFTMLKGRVVR